MAHEPGFDDDFDDPNDYVSSIFSELREVIADACRYSFDDVYLRLHFRFLELGLVELNVDKIEWGQETNKPTYIYELEFTEDFQLDDGYGGEYTETFRHGYVVVEILEITNSISVNLTAYNGQILYDSFCDSVERF